MTHPVASGTAAPEPAIRKIAVLRANGIGDFVFALPALEALRGAYPDAEIVLLAGGWQAPFLEARPGPVDRVVAVPPSRGVREEPGAIEDPVVLDGFFRGMRDEAFDLAVQLHGGGRHSNPFVRRLGARLAIGLKSADAEPLDRWIPYVYFQPEILRYLEVVGLAGAPPLTIEPRLEVTDADLAESFAVVPDSSRPIVLLNPGASDPRRRWPAAKFAEVGDALEREGATIVVNGNGPEHCLVSGVIDAMARPALDLCGGLSLGGLAGLLSRCRLVISNDSGPLHLAGAVGAATVGIYWCGNLFTAGPATRARHRPAISWRLECPVCGANTLTDHCAHRASFVDDVRAADVLASAHDLLESRAPCGCPVTR